MGQLASTLSWWSDGISFILLGLMYIALPLPPANRLWPRAGEGIWWGLVVFSNVVWNIYRYIAEGIIEAAVPRGFMELSLIYCVVWCYTLGFGWDQDARVFRRTTKIMRELKRLKTVRRGESSRKSNESQRSFGDDRRKQKEIAVREGCARQMWPYLLDVRVMRYDMGKRNENFVKVEWAEAAQSRLCVLSSFRDCTGRYWRGKEQLIEKHTCPQTKQVLWFVRIFEEELHRDTLEPLMRPGILKDFDDPKSKLFKAIYDVVYSSCRQHQRNNTLKTMWPNEMWGPLEPEELARKSGCDVDDDRPDKERLTLLGNIARKIASDAVCYIYSTDGFTENRVQDQVKKMNEIVEQIAKDEMSVLLNSEPASIETPHA
jgi:hypothetical protein